MDWIHSMSMSDLQHAANGGDRGEEVNIVYLWHMHSRIRVRIIGIPLRRFPQPGKGSPNL